MSSHGAERSLDRLSSPGTPQDVEAFFTDLVLHDPEYVQGVDAEAVEDDARGLGDGHIDPNPARQERLYEVAHENAAVSASQLPPL